MSTYKVLVNNSKRTEATYKIGEAGSKSLRIKAQDKVNYMLVDGVTGNAPQNMVIKRVGKNLQIAFEGRDIAHPDIVIEDFYQYPNSHVLGRSELGVLHEFVVKSNNQVVQVVDLTNESMATAALDGAAVASPLWSDSVLGNAITAVVENLGMAELAAVGFGAAGLRVS